MFWFSIYLADSKGLLFVQYNSLLLCDSKKWTSHHPCFSQWLWQLPMSNNPWQHVWHAAEERAIEICRGSHIQASFLRVSWGNRQLNLTLKEGMLTGRGGREKNTAVFPQRKDGCLWLSGCKNIVVLGDGQRFCLLATRADGLHSQKQSPLYVWAIFSQSRSG